MDKEFGKKVLYEKLTMIVTVQQQQSKIIFLNFYLNFYKINYNQFNCFFICSSYPSLDDVTCEVLCSQHSDAYTGGAAGLLPPTELPRGSPPPHENNIKEKVM